MTDAEDSEKVSLSNFLTLYFGHLGMLHERGGEAFGHAQAAALLTQKTSIVLNSSAIGILATAASTRLVSIQDIDSSALCYLSGIILSVVSCFSSFINLSKHSESYELKARIASHQINIIRSNKREREEFESQIAADERSQTELGETLDCTFWLSLTSLLFSYVAFLAGSYFLSQATII